MCSFNIVNASTGNYYIAVCHRYIIETWTQNPSTYISGENSSYNFTDLAARAYGSNQIKVDDSPLRFGIFSGDVNQDGTIDLNDVLFIYNAAESFSSGYVVKDVNGDNTVDLNDVLIAYNNSTGFVAVVKS